MALRELGPAAVPWHLIPHPVGHHMGRLAHYVDVERLGGIVGNHASRDHGSARRSEVRALPGDSGISVRKCLTTACRRAERGSLGAWARTSGPARDCREARRLSRRGFLAFALGFTLWAGPESKGRFGCRPSPDA